MSVLAIVASGPVDHLPNLQEFPEVKYWIGVDRGAYVLAEKKKQMDLAIGDFDSVTADEGKRLEQYTKKLAIYPSEKNETDLELALEKAFAMQVDTIYLFGVTGGRMDHTMVNIQLLLQIKAHKMKGVIIDKWNRLELLEAGSHRLEKNAAYPYVSFVPLTESVQQLTLEGFLYSLENYQLSWGSSRCISNEITEKTGRISFDRGKLLQVQSRDP